MTGILYLILGSLCGKELAEIFVGQKKTGKNNRIWLVLPGAFGVGMLAFGWVTYLIAWAASAAGADKPLIANPLDNGQKELFFFWASIFRDTGKTKGFLQIRVWLRINSCFGRTDIFFCAVCISYLDHILCILHKGRDSVFRIYRVRRLCAPYGNDAVFFFAE